MDFNKHAANTSSYHYDNKINYKEPDSSCALAGQTGGAIRLSLIFLLLFPSREKEEKMHCHNLYFFQFSWSPDQHVSSI